MTADDLARSSFPQQPDFGGSLVVHELKPKADVKVRSLLYLRPEPDQVKGIFGLGE